MNSESGAAHVQHAGLETNDSMGPAMFKKRIKEANDLNEEHCRFLVPICRYKNARQ